MAPGQGCGEAVYGHLTPTAGCIVGNRGVGQVKARPCQNTAIAPPPTRTALTHAVTGGSIRAHLRVTYRPGQLGGQHGACPASTAGIDECNKRSHRWFGRGCFASVFKVTWRYPVASGRSMQPWRMQCAIDRDTCTKNECLFGRTGHTPRSQLVLRPLSEPLSSHGSHVSPSRSRQRASRACHAC
jgi:hypothetical protein